MPDAAIEMTSRADMVSTSASPDLVPVIPMPSMANTVAKIPMARISEWAKLMRRSTPYTSV